MRLWKWAETLPDRIGKGRKMARQAKNEVTVKVGDESFVCTFEIPNPANLKRETLEAVVRNGYMPVVRGIVSRFYATEYPAYSKAKSLFASVLETFGAGEAFEKWAQAQISSLGYDPRKEFPTHFNITEDDLVKAEEAVLS